MSRLRVGCNTARTVLAVSVVFALYAGGYVDAEERQEKNVSQGVAARVGDEVITVQELEQLLARELARLEAQRHRLMASKLEDLIEARLLAQEAKRRGTSVEELLRAEVYLKAAEVTETELAKFLAENRSRFQGSPLEVRLRVWDYLRRPKVAERRRAFVESLRRNATVDRFLEEPEPARVAVSVEGAFFQGSKDALVTIVEFSDFHCPFCRRVVSTMKQVMKQYAGQVKWVYRDFPIAGLHPQAPKAAEAARCAGEQGKFWEYHDLLFDSGRQSTTTHFKRLAEQVNLDGKSFADCLDREKYRAAVKSDLQDGSRLGVTGTPTFFINGRVLRGAQPLGTFQQIIESELRRHARRRASGS